MAIFNEKVKTKAATALSYEGATLYEKSLEEDWINFICSSMLSDRFYEPSKEQMERYIGLTKDMLAKYGPVFVAKAAKFVRNECGLRTISQLTAAILNGESFDCKREFFTKFFRRPDDVAEVFGAIDMLGGKRSHALVRGVADYLKYRVDDYQMAKYATPLSRRKYNMMDIINIAHATSPSIDKYKAGTLEAPDTWEVKVGGAETQEQREAEWKRLVEEGRMGYLALLRNLRNILDCSFITVSWIKDKLCPQVENKVAIEKSLVFPYQIYSAYKALNEANRRNPNLTCSLDAAFRHAVRNMPLIDGKTCVMLDVSGSMDSTLSRRSSGITMRECGAAYAAAILLANPKSKFVKFGNRAKEVSVSVVDNVFDTIDRLQRNDGCGWGTDIIPAFDVLGESFDRIFIISDMQVMDDPAFYYWDDTDIRKPKAVMRAYFKKYGKSRVYSFDLANYKTKLATEDTLTMLTGLNDKVFEMLKILEQGESLVTYIDGLSL